MLHFMRVRQRGLGLVTGGGLYLHILFTSVYILHINMNVNMSYVSYIKFPHIYAHTYVYTYIYMSVSYYHICMMLSYMYIYISSIYVYIGIVVGHE